MPWMPRKKLTEFLPATNNLHWWLVTWLEGVLGREAKDYEGSYSWLYPPDGWTKYKVVPYDRESRPPLTGLDDGVLIAIDRDSVVPNDHPQVPFHPELVEIGAGARRWFSVIPFPTPQPAESRREVLQQVGQMIRVIEEV